MCLWSRSGHPAARAMHTKQSGVVPVRQKLLLLIFPFQLREVCLSWIMKKKKKRGKWSRLGTLANTEKNMFVHILFVHVCERARACKYMGGCLFFRCIVKVDWKGTAHAPLPGLDPVAMALHSSAEKCVCLLELNQMKAVLPGSRFASGPCFWRSQPCCFSLGHS